MAQRLAPRALSAGCASICSASALRDNSTSRPMRSRSTASQPSGQRFVLLRHLRDPCHELFHPCILASGKGSPVAPRSGKPCEPDRDEHDCKDEAEYRYAFHDHVPRRSRDSSVGCVIQCCSWGAWSVLDSRTMSARLRADPLA